MQHLDAWWRLVVGEVHVQIELCVSVSYVDGLNFRANVEVLAVPAQCQHTDREVSANNKTTKIKKKNNKSDAE